MATLPDLERLRPLRHTVAVVGVGDTDYAADYRAGQDGAATGKGEGARDSYTLAARAFRRALDDAGLQKYDIDGLCAG
jgi:3-oxoacyl-[acyl-carrier-protein] synthase III